MSADNGIYVIKYKEDDYRITHCTNIDDVFDEEGKPIKEVVDKLFPKRDAYTKEKALLLAHELEEKILSDEHFPILEYGVNYLGDFSDIT